ncbi:MAG: hypothetical protein M1830_007073 [Pleopsidium flavum]|nr:MAG: hypothetical protein M1830_007073 [Pleopsidium flavum]
MAMNDTPSISSPINWKSKFQLPSLPPLSVSLTAGTDIPPPAPEPDTPPEPAQSPAARTNPLSLHPTTPSDLIPGAFPTSPSPQQQETTPYFHRVQPTSPSNYNSPPTSPVSPSSTKRPSSIRRFLSLRSLNSTYNNSPESPSSPISQRPGSPSAGSRPGLRKKKSGSWFRRRNSMGFEELVAMNANALDHQNVVEEVENRRPLEVALTALERPRSPPPRLPELVNLGTRLDGGVLGAEEMFRNIF